MQLPARIGKYELQEFLGGGMSHVYRALDTVIGRTVAVKILTEAGCTDAEAKARFLQEARLAGNLTHENVIAIYDFGEDQGRPFMVMEFLRGEDLRHAIKNSTTGDLRAKLRTAIQIAAAMEYIHSQGIIHRDIKPENIRLTSTGVKLMDFGIAKTSGMQMTRAGFVLGTPYYMAPEQVLGKPVNELVDIYAFGILLYELLSGLKPITGESVERIFYSILHDPLKLEPLRQGGMPEPLCNFVARCTAKNPVERPQSFSAVLEELRQIQKPLEPRKETTAPPPAGLSRRAWMAVAAAAVVLLFAVGTYRLLHRSEGLQKTLLTPTGEMVLVPAGPFLFGEKKEPVSLPDFYIDRTEVTNAAYQKFCEATKRPLPREFPKNRPDHPVVDISIVDAQLFVRWAGKRLPTAREWEKAARGGDGRLFPWGNDPNPRLADVKDNPNLIEPSELPVNSFKNGASPYGALQMVGNVWEFVDQISTPGPQALDYFGKLLKPPPTADEPWYTIRGLSFAEPLSDKVLWDATTIPSTYRDFNIGFRCVKDP